MSNIIQFPQERTRPSAAEYDLETTYELTEQMIDSLDDFGYDIEDEQLQKDISVLANLMFASFRRREKGEEHVFQDVLDELHEMVEAARQYMIEVENANDDNPGL